MTSIEYKNSISIKRTDESDLGDILGFMIGSEESYIEAPKEIFGKLFKEGTNLKITLFYDPLFDNLKRDRKIFSYGLPLKNSVEKNQRLIYLSLPSEEINKIEAILTKLSNEGAGNYELVFENILKTGSLELKLTED